MYRRSFGFGNSIGLSMTRAVKWLLIANVGVFMLQQMMPGPQGQSIDALSLLFGLQPWKVIHELALYQFATYMFLHGGFFHIFFNMLMLWMFGRELEERWGSKYFMKYYMITGIGAGITSFLFSVGAGPHNVTIGASGAIMALLVAFAMNAPDRQVYLWFIVPIKIKYLVMLLIAIDLFAAPGHDGVAHFAHLGGALIGYLYLKSDWRIFQLGKKWNDYRYERRVKSLRKKHEATRKVMDEVDRVLDRINEVGYEGLTREEKRILEEASELLSRKNDS